VGEPQVVQVTQRAGHLWGHVWGECAYACACGRNSGRYL
jgi:hypothetical protein